MTAERLDSSNIRLDAVYRDHDDYFPMPIDESITTPRIVSKIDEEGVRLQRWFIESPAMKRVVEVQVMHPEPSEDPTPMLYLLDGVSAQQTSGWLRRNQLVETLRQENVIVVIPTQAGGTMYTDWTSYHQKLGVQKWETFLSSELHQVMESEAAGLQRVASVSVVYL